jgi:ubiquinone/menaquinone biosynthesis C-methylase UbiE
MYRRARRRIQQAGVEVDRRVLGGERLPFEDGTFDCAVSTFTLCSIEEVAQAVRELYRVLKPGGKFLFLEHGLSSTDAPSRAGRQSENPEKQGDQELLNSSGTPRLFK